MPLKLLEPLRELFKDEVREVGQELGLPDSLVWRHPFPGPGLAIRILGEVTADKLDILREADAIVQEEMLASEFYRQVWQAFAVLLPIRTVGVMGDERTYEFVVALAHRGFHRCHDRGLEPPAPRISGRDSQPHHQRSQTGQPGGAGHFVQAAEHH